MKRLLTFLLLALGALLLPQAVRPQSIPSPPPDLPPRTASPNALDLCPASPLFGIYVLQYSRGVWDDGELLAGPTYTNIQYDFGETNAVGFFVGYRHFLWKGLHVEYQLWPTWDNFYEKNEDAYYRGFDLWNEFRVGYQFDFTVSDVPCYLSVQWPFGFALYSENKPASFEEHAEQNPFFYYPPLFFVGVRF